MKTVTFNEIKDKFNRMAILWASNTHGIAEYYTKRNGTFYPVFDHSKHSGDAVLAEISKLNPEVTLFETGEEYAKAQTEICYPGKKMYGFANEGIVDYVDSEKSVTFYFD